MKPIRASKRMIPFYLPPEPQRGWHPAENSAVRQAYGAAMLFIVYCLAGLRFLKLSDRAVAGRIDLHELAARFAALRHDEHRIVRGDQVAERRRIKRQLPLLRAVGRVVPGDIAVPVRHHEHTLYDYRRAANRRAQRRMPL